MVLGIGTSCPLVGSMRDLVAVAGDLILTPHKGVPAMLFAFIGTIAIPIYLAATTGRIPVSPIPRVFIAVGLFFASMVALTAISLAMRAVYLEAPGTSVVAVSVWQWVSFLIILALQYSGGRYVYRKLSGQSGLTPDELEALETQLRQRGGG